MRRKYREDEALFYAKGYGRLATYNAQRAEGIVHTEAYDAEMVVLQEQFVAEQIAEADAKGWIVVGRPA